MKCVAMVLLACLPLCLAEQWPSFRGANACGLAEGQNLPERWNGSTGENIRWKTAVPGLAHSSPVVWDDRIYVTSAISSRSNATFKHGLFGEGDASEDRSVHQWKVFCLDRKTGKILWDRTAYEGAPREKRHVKGTYANSTPATDGAHVVAFFGSHGLYCFDSGGRLIRKALWEVEEHATAEAYRMKPDSDAYADPTVWEPGRSHRRGRP